MYKKRCNPWGSTHTHTHTHTNTFTTKRGGTTYYLSVSPIYLIISKDKEVMS